MRALIPGASGYVGQVIQRACKEKSIEVLPLSRKVYSYDNPEAFRRLLIAAKPDVVINCAGYIGKPNVDACEDDKGKCFIANVTLPFEMAEACHENNIPFGHISTGCIFTGYQAEEGFTEDDAPNFTFRQNNCSFYSGVKALAEEILQPFEKIWIWRLRIPFENTNNPRNYLTKVIQYKKLLNVRNSLSYLPEFANACVDSFLKMIPFGTYNITNPGSVTTEEVVKLLQKYGLIEGEKDYFSSLEDFMKAVRAPRSSCVLSSEKARKAGLKLSDVHEALEFCARNWIN